VGASVQINVRFTLRMNVARNR